jgi:hypothetical protein
MKTMIAWVLMLSLVGCATMSPVTGSPTELQQRIAARELLQPGDHVRIITSDGKNHDFTVTSVSAYSVDGSKESILVKDVFAVEKREPRVGVTIGLVILAVLAVVGVVEAETLGHASH